MMYRQRQAGVLDVTICVQWPQCTRHPPEPPRKHLQPLLDQAQSPVHCPLTFSLLCEPESPLWWDGAQQSLLPLLPSGLLCSWTTRSASSVRRVLLPGLSVQSSTQRRAWGKGLRVCLRVEPRRRVNLAPHRRLFVPNPCPGLVRVF